MGGLVEAAIRADDAIGVAQDFIDNEDPNTLLITSADSMLAVPKSAMLMQTLRP